jgi:hypothetical protein
MTRDWDLLDECCDTAALNKYVDSDCTNMPARPVEDDGSYDGDGPKEWEEGVVQVWKGGGVCGVGGGG